MNIFMYNYKRKIVETFCAEKAVWIEKVKHITPILIRKVKTKEDKVSSFAQIRDYLKKKFKVKKVEWMFWTAEKIVDKWKKYNP